MTDLPDKDKEQGKRGRKISRRTVLRVIGGGAALATVSGLGLVAVCSRRDLDEPLAIRLTWAFPDLADPARVGRRYLAAYPEEDDVRLLTAMIDRTSSQSPEEVTCSATAARALGRQSMEDFQAKRVVWIDGWLMARTEARVCALASHLGSITTA